MRGRVLPWLAAVALWGVACGDSAPSTPDGGGVDARVDAGPICNPALGEWLCADACVDRATNPEHCGICNNACDADEVCARGVCQGSCGPPMVDCGGSCIDPANDPRFCGASDTCSGATAGTICEPGNVCVDGQCILSCPTTLLRCADRCVDPDWDRNYCGASDDCAGPNAGTICEAGQVCSNGACLTSCPSGSVECAGRCVDPLTDRSYCGASGDCTGLGSGAVCAAGQICSGGVCALSCQTGLIECNSVCIDPQENRDFCGASGLCAGDDVGTACDAGEVCSMGECALSCQPGLLDCDGVCVDPAMHRSFCGATADCEGANAGTVCAPGEVCATGQCQLSCPGGLINCGGNCIDPLTSRLFCGASGDCVAPNAGNICDPGAICDNGACLTSCPLGQIVCDGRCVNPDSDPQYCGASGDCLGGNSGVTCGLGEACSTGFCTLTCPPGTTNCGGQCVDTDSNPNHCGQCFSPSPAGLRCCSGVPTDLMNDPLSCGACGQAVPPGEVCCGGGPTDLTSDRLNCTQCGLSCELLEDCVASVCTEVEWRMAITIDGSSLAADLTDYPVELLLDNNNFRYKRLLPSGNDLRFSTNAAGPPYLPHWFELWAPAGSSSVWVNVPLIRAGQTETIYAFFGVPTRTATVTDRDATFPNRFISSGDGALPGGAFDWFEVRAGDTMSLVAGSTTTIVARRVIFAGNVLGQGAGYTPGAPLASGNGPGGGGTSFNAGAGGAGHAGPGGRGGYDLGDGFGAGGAAYGDVSLQSVDMGSGGGSSNVVPGGAGGGALIIRSRDIETLDNLNLSGLPGTSGTLGGGGGAGGGLLLQGFDVRVGGLVSLAGGAGGDGLTNADNGGGGGAGGWYKVFAQGVYINTATVSLAGGPGGQFGTEAPGAAGSPGVAIENAQTLYPDVTVTFGPDEPMPP